MTRSQLLVVEDDDPIRELVCEHLESQGYGCEPARTGPEALRLVHHHRFDLIVLDVMLPGLDGLTLTRRIRLQSANRRIPILMLTARREEQQKVHALITGADDYVTKPFGLDELSARVYALLRRARGESPPSAVADPTPLSIKELDIDVGRHRLVVRGEPVSPTPYELALLYALAVRAGTTVSRAQLLDDVWRGEAFVTERSVDTLVWRLRRKIERDPLVPVLIQTVWGKGYRFNDD